MTSSAACIEILFPFHFDSRWSWASVAIYIQLIRTLSSTNILSSLPWLEAALPIHVLSQPNSFSYFSGRHVYSCTGKPQNSRQLYQKREAVEVTSIITPMLLLLVSRCFDDCLSATVQTVRLRVNFFWGTVIAFDLVDICFARFEYSLPPSHPGRGLAKFVLVLSSLNRLPYYQKSLESRFAWFLMEFEEERPRCDYLGLP
jgi:hypothetical protein